MGHCKEELKQYKEAIKDFDTAIELDENDSYNYKHRADCKLELMLYKEAIKDYEKVIELSESIPDKIENFLNIQCCLEEVDVLETERILNLCNEILEKESTNISVLIYKVYSLLFLKREYELMIEIILKVLEKDEKFADKDFIYWLITNAYIGLKNYPEAEKWAIKYTEIKPNEAEPFIVLLWIYAEQKQKDKVQELLVICNQKDKDWQKRRGYKAIVMSLDKLDK